MKLIATVIASLFAVTAFAAEPAKTEVKPAAPAASAPAKVEAKKEAEVKKTEAKPAKSTPVKDEKAAGPATKPASK